jgi:NAD(P)-dependent dehydrogenase (short-subunit alcohol dehydrogenase family)
MASWSTADIPPQDGRRVIVTGTGGIGYETALALAAAGADVVLAGRDPSKGHASVARIQAHAPGARIAFEALDLASLASVADFAARMARRLPALDLLVNNAGVMMPPTRRTTADGFELQFGTNHLGHYALTARLLPLLRAGRAPRVVTVSSDVHRFARMEFDNLQSERRYRPMTAYAQSKLANLLFTAELARLNDAHAWGLISLAAHPGFARTDIIANGPGTWPMAAALRPILSQSAADGALPILLAASAPGLPGGTYYGPKGLLESKGPPGRARPSRRARSTADADRLWDVSARLTGVAWPSS